MRAGRSLFATLPIQLLCALAIVACAKGADPVKGADGTSCSAHSNGDGTTTISCTDGTSATVSNGASGKDGSNGTDGASCTVADNGNGTRTITCGTTSVTILDGAVTDYAVLSPSEQADINPSAVITGVTIPADGRPVVTLKVSDRKGNGIKHLTAVSPINWRFSLLKLEPGSADGTAGGAKLGVNGAAIDTWVSYMAANATSTASTESAGVDPNSTSAGLLTDNNDGTYTYRFAKVITNADAAGTTYEASKTHRLIVLLYGTGNPFAPINLVKDFVPATGADVTGQNDKVDPAACLECHTRFRALPAGKGAFHNGQRYNVNVCVACHNDQRRFTAIPGTGSTPLANDASVQADGTWTGNMMVLNGEAVINLPVFIHKIHMGEELGMTGGSYAAVQFPEVTYPQDVRNCTKCHRAPAAKAANWQIPNRRVCNSCHDTVSFLSPAPNGRTTHLTNYPYSDDTWCASCHNAAALSPPGPGSIAASHVAIAPPDANSTWAGGTNSNTNAAYLAAANSLPAGANKITYLVQSVSRDGNKHPVIVFKLQMDGTDVVFNTWGSGKTELIDNFAGSPTVYFAWSLPQDGIQAPADFNITASGYVKRIWNGTATGASAGTLSGPTSGWYTITLTGAVVADSATQLTGGLGYAYSLGPSPTSSSTSQPLTQVNLPDFPYNSTTGIGGLIVPSPDVWVVATGYTGRRVVVSNAKCNGCHEALGANPTFHAGQRNNSPTCAFCHRPNQTSSGWSASSSSYIHGIHGASKRTNPFTWHASSPTKTFAEVTFPGVLNDCEMCHVPGGYDFSTAAQQSAYPRMLSSTVAQGRYNSNPVTNPNGYFSISPFVASDNQTDYGYGYATSNVSATLPDGISGTQGSNSCTPAAPCICTTANPCSVDVSAPYTVYNVPVTFTQKIGTVTTTCAAGTPCTCTTAQPCTGIVATCSATAPCNAQGTTLVTSPIVAACTGCHDSAMAIDHMENNGGSFYQPRASALTKPQQEQCLICHGPGTIAAIADMHMTR